MTNPSMMVPGDFEVESAAIARKRKVLDALAAQGMKGNEGQMVSGHYVAPSAFENIASLVNVWAAKSGNKDLDKQESENNSNYQSGLGTAVQDYLDTRNGRQGVEPNQGPMPDGSAMEGVNAFSEKGDPRKAIVEAMTSQYKPLQTLGAAELGQLGKQNMTSKDILALSGYSPKSKVAAALAGDPSLLRSESKQHVVNNQLVSAPTEDDPATPTRVSFDGRDKFSNPEEIMIGPDGKKLVGQRDANTGKVTWAPVGTTVNVDTNTKGATAFAVKANELAVKKLEESQDAATKAQHSFEVYSNAKSQIAKVAGGTGADTILAAKKVAQMLGVPIDDTVTSQEQVAAALGQGVLDNSKLLGSGNGFTDKDREFLQNIVLGKTSLDHATLKRAVDLGLAASLNTMKSHETLIDGAGKIEGATPEVLNQFRVKIPHYTLSGDDFDFDPSTGRFGVKTAAGGGANPLKSPTAPTARNTGLSPAEAAELKALKAKHGVQ